MSDSQKKSPPVEQHIPSVKQTYYAPQLHAFGRVSNLTHTTGFDLLANAFALMTAPSLPDNPTQS